MGTLTKIRGQFGEMKMDGVQYSLGLFFPVQLHEFMTIIVEISCNIDILQNKGSRDFPGGAVVKNLPASAGDMGSRPGPRRSHMPRSN